MSKLKDLSILQARAEIALGLIRLVYQSCDYEILVYAPLPLKPNPPLHL